MYGKWLIGKPKLSVITNINKYKTMFKLSQIKPFIIQAVISCIHFLFRMLNWNHFKQKHENGKYYYTKIVKIKGFRTAIVDNIWGARANIRFYWTIGKYNL